MKKLLALSILFVFTLFSYSISMKNPDSVTLTYFGGLKVEVELFLVLFTPFAIGMLLGVLIMSVSVLRNKLRAGTAARKLVKAEQEVDNLRSAQTVQAVPGTTSSNGIESAN